MISALQALKTGEVFKAKSDLGASVRCLKEDEKTIFVFAPRRRRYGKRYSIEEFISHFLPDIMTEEEKERSWHKRCLAIERRLAVSGLWPNLLQVFKNLQKVSYTDRAALRNLYFSRDVEKQEILLDFSKKYPFMFKDGHLDTDYIFEISEGKVKSMYFGSDNKKYKEEIAIALFEHMDISRTSQAKYDVRFTYDAKSEKAWYSEEYRGCGNGHYYLALDGSCALFVEND